MAKTIAFVDELTAARSLSLESEKSALEEKRIDDLPFNPKLKYHASLSVLTEHNKKKQIYIVGAPEAVIAKSLFILKNGRKARLTKEDLKALNKNIDLMTSKAMRATLECLQGVSRDVLSW